MKRSFYILISMFLLGFQAWSQTVVSNVIAKREENRQIRITYDITTLDSIVRYKIKLYFVPTNTSEKEFEILDAEGDVGDNFGNGKDKSILWNPFKSDKNFVSKGAFKITALRYKDGMVYVSIKSDSNQNKQADFWMDKLEVTNNQFNEFVTATKYVTESEKLGKNFVKTKDGWEQQKNINWHYESNGEKRKTEIGNKVPVVFVTWNDATAYCKWKLKRLPNSFEWEYSASGGVFSKGYQYSGSNDVQSVAWYQKNNERNSLNLVGTKAPNELYIFDMSGNVSEWCSDNFDGSAEISGKKIVKGGSVFSSQDALSLKYRSPMQPDNSYGDVGFRCACSVENKDK